MAGEENVCRIFPLIKEVRAYVKQVEETGDHGKRSLVFSARKCSNRIFLVFIRICQFHWQMQRLCYTKACCKYVNYFRSGLS